MRMSRRTGLTVAALVVSLLTSTALACTTVVLGRSQQPLVAYSFDYAATDAGLLLVNPASGTRRSVLGDRAAQWTIRHGSVTVNQMGPGMPAAGMNTAGLVVSLMWNDDAIYGGDDLLPEVSELEFIQRLLDTSDSVEDALNAVAEVRIQGFVPIHFFLADRTGAVAILTPTAKGLDVTSGEQVTVPALTNTDYGVLTRRIHAFVGFGGAQTLPGSSDDSDSLRRFLTAAMAAGQEEPVSAANAFALLDRVANRSSRWQLVFDPDDQRMAVRLAGQESAQQIDLAQVDFSCDAFPLAVELAANSYAAGLQTLEPMTAAQISAVSRSVLATLPPEAGLGPDLANGLTATQLASIHCAP